MYLIFNIGVQQVQTSSCIAVDPAFVIIFTQSHAALPKFVLDKLPRQQIVLRGLELPCLQVVKRSLKAQKRSRRFS